MSETLVKHRGSNREAQGKGKGRSLDQGEQVLASVPGSERVNSNRHYNPTPDPVIKVSLHVPDSLVQAIDWARGNTSRMEWIRQACREKLGEASR